MKRGGVRKTGYRKVKASDWKASLAALEPSENMSRRQEDVEDIQEYVHLLSPDEKQWMAQFMREYNNAMLDFQNLDNNLHNTPELKKACTDRNNARNRCIYTREKAQGALNYASNDYELENYLYGSSTSEVSSEDLEEPTDDPDEQEI